MMSSIDESIEIKWSDGSEMLLPTLWLRDNCLCEDCRIVQTTEKKFVVADVPVGLKPTRVDVLDGTLKLQWPDGHQSEFSEKFIRGLSESQTQKITLWQQDHRPFYADYGEFMGQDQKAIEAIEQFLETGVIVLSQTPRTTETLEELHVRLGPMREMVFARIHEVVIDPSGYNVAHTNLALPPHNDFASMNWPPSVQALHMLANDCDGGETVIVDGWSVANQLKEDHPEYFDILCQFEVPFRMFSEEIETYAENTLIKLDREGNIAHVRYSNQLMQAVNPTLPGVALFYRAYHELSRRLLSDQAKAVFRLNAGECLLVAGHRVLHARNAFVANGVRHLQDAYYEHDHLRNHLTVLRRKASS